MKKKNKNNEKKKKILWVFLTLIVVVIISMIAIKRIGRIGLIVTGNVDVFDALCTPDTSCVLTDQDGNTVGGTVDAFNIQDKNYTWDSIKPLKIFSNSFYENTSKIAPGSTNAYEFIINNGYNYDLVYDINFMENNEHNVNMQYKLRKNGEYILGNEDNFDYISNIDLKALDLDRHSYDTYLLEWKWVDSKNDTEVGVLNDATYGLEINVIATSK